MARELHVGQLFPTPLISTMVRDVDAGKITSIIQSLRDAGFMYSGPNVAGIQTQGNFLLIDHPEVKKLREVFVEIIHTVSKGQDNPLALRGWANVLRKNDRSADTPHGHLPYHWSAVYYPQVPSLTDREGYLLFFDPREVFCDSRPTGIAPQTGLFVMFPSWLRHTVAPVMHADEDRISVSLNAMIGPALDAPAAQLPPHRLKKREPGLSPPQEFDPAAPAEFAYPL